MSELNGLFVGFDDNNLYLLFTGNLENNFNKFDLFIDSEPGGQNTITPTNPMFDLNDALNTVMVGMTFDPTFFRDHVLTFGHDGTTGFANFASLGTVILQSTRSGPIASISTSNGIQLALNNSNMGGVSDVAVNNPQSVSTGIEISIPLTEINVAPGDVVKIMGIVNNGDHNYLSNQSLPPLPLGTGNLGGDGLGNFNGTLGGINFSNFTGDQCIVIPLTLPAIPTLSEWGILILFLSISVIGVIYFKFLPSKQEKIFYN